MPDAAHDTLCLFDNTALGWTVETPLAQPQPAASASTERDAESAHEEAAPLVWTKDFCLDGDRGLARGWTARAHDNIAAIRLSKELEACPGPRSGERGRAPTAEEQERLLRFVGFGATELAQNCFPLPGGSNFRPGWEAIGRALAETVSPAEYAALQRATQYAHYTPEPIIRALWRAVRHLGFTGGRVLEPGMGTGLFFALMPAELRETTQLTGIEYCPVTARIARLVHPEARIRCEDYTRSRLGGGFDLAIGNPPFADRIVRADRATAALGLRLHDYFIARSIARLRPGGIALFVTSTGTMDKASRTAREHIASMADLVGAVRLPEASMRATAGTDVVIDVLVFQRRAEGRAPTGTRWMNLVEIELDSDASQKPEGEGRPLLDSYPVDGASDQEERRGTGHSLVEVNEYFAAHPEMVLGEHTQRRGIYGPAPTYTRRPRPNDPPLEQLLDTALARLPRDIFAPSQSPPEEDADDENIRGGVAAEGASIKEGSYFIDNAGRLMQIANGAAAPVAVKKRGGGEGVTPKAARIIRALIPIRDAVREVLRAQAADRPWAQAQVRLRVAYAAFLRYFGPISHTVVTVTTEPETGEEREIHRRPNLAPFADDPDCWLVASIEDYDLESGLARMGPVFRDRVISPPATPVIASAADALAVTLDETGRVDPEHLAELLECDPDAALSQLGAAVFRNPLTLAWETADAYLSGPVRTKLAAAEAAAALDRQYERNVAALREVQPRDIRPSDITARLYVKSRFIDQKNPRRALIQASGTPITNTLGEMYTLLRFQSPEALFERGVHEFDAWASAFGDTRIELELQPSGAYKPVERFCEFINVAELIDMFRTVADVVLKYDLHGCVDLPRIKGGRPQLITAEASDAFHDYQQILAERIEAIEHRTGRVQKGDDILLAVITDGRHSAIDMRLVWPGNGNEPGNKLNKLIANVHRIWRETAGSPYRRPDGSPFPIPGAGQLIYSDLGTISVEAKRGFSAYRWIKHELVRLGIPAAEIAFMQDFKRSADKQRLFNEFNAGRVRILIGSSDTMGTGVNVQLRLKALHHLDVPWLPSQIDAHRGGTRRHQQERTKRC